MESDDSSPDRTKNIINRIINFFKKNSIKDSSLKTTLEEALNGDLGEHKQEDFSSDEKDMIRNMITVGEVTAGDVMLPRNDIIAIENTAIISEIKEIIMQERHTRMPVFDGDLDNLTGFIHLKDLVPYFAEDENFTINKILREVMFISPSMKIVDLLVQMRISGDHIAIVVDEYGGTDGLVTLEDLFEEIVGDIQDEHDIHEKEESLRKISDNIYEAGAKIRLDELEEELNRKISDDSDDEEIDTLGGLIFLRLGRIPARGELLEINQNIKLEIMDADPRRICSVRIILGG